MTVQATTTKTTQNCNGSLTDFSFNFAIYKQEDLVVIVRDSEQTETLLVLGTDYTVSSDDLANGGTVSTIKEIAEDFLPFAWSADYTITIMLNIALTQETDLLYGGTFAAESIEKMSDRLTRIVQQLNEQLQRTVKLQKSSGQEGIEIDDLEAGKFVIVNTVGDGLVMGTVAGEPGQSPISNIPYDKNTWNAVTDIAPSKNTVRDELVNNRFTKGGTYATVMALSHGIFSAFPVSNIVYGASWADIVDTAASKKAIYDKIEAMGDGAGDVVGPATNLDDYVPQWNGVNSKTLKNGFAITAAGKAILDDADNVAQRTTLGLGSAALRTAEDVLTDGSNLPDGHAIKIYGDANWGGAGEGDVVGPASAINHGICLFDDVTGKLVKDSARLIEDTLTDGSNLPDGHAIKIYGDANWGGNYTNLTSFIDQTAWRLFYSNAAGDVIELALGTVGQYLKANGVTSAPTWGVPGGAGDVVGPATHAASYVPQWNTTPNSKTLIAGFAITAAGKAILDDADNVAQRTTLGLGSAALRTAEDVLTDGSNLPDGHAIKIYGDANWGGVVGPATHAASYVPQWNTTPNSKTLIAGFAITAAGKAILDDADNVAQRTTLGFTSAILNKGIPGTIGQTTPGNVYSNRLKMSGQAGFILRSVSGSGYKTINWTTGLKYKLSLTGNVVLSFDNPTDVCNVLIEVVQPASGGRTVTFPDSVAWTPSINSAANSVTIVCLFWDGTNYYGGGISNA